MLTPGPVRQKPTCSKRYTATPRPPNVASTQAEKPIDTDSRHAGTTSAKPTKLTRRTLRHLVPPR
jgi:hypothetical protein